ncbi:MAG: metal ABC transporter substrate-binding protein [Microbacteriaceae bacterium]|nr:metal ABC transporter substrate-binding protein [Microbacteriaceae bacterium]
MARRVLHAVGGAAVGISAVLISVLLLAACSPGDAPPTRESGSAEGAGDDRPLVLTTFTVLADIAQHVAGDHLRVESLTKPGTEIHGYEPTPGDLRRAAGADLIIDNGLGLEAWFEQFMHDLDAPHVVASDGVQVIDITGDEAAGLPNPHAWMSALEAQRYVENISAAFVELDPEHADDYRHQAAAYTAELQQVQGELLDALHEVPAAQRVLVTCEGAFSYLARDAGLGEVSIWPVNAEQQATPRRIAAVIDAVRERAVPAVFCESTVSADPMHRVVESSDATFGGTLYVDSLSAADGPVPTYLALLRYNAQTIVSALTEVQE